MGILHGCFQEWCVCRRWGLTETLDRSRDSRVHSLALILVFFAVCGFTIQASDLRGQPEDEVWYGPQGLALPFESHEEVLDFLRTAEPVSFETVSQGINDTRKVLLEKEGLQAHGVFRTVHVSKDKAVFANNIVKYNFRDEALFEVAAYRLARLLGLNNVPPTVERPLWGKRGTLQLWIENARTEKHRIKSNSMPEDVDLWRLQVQTMRIFDNLICNDDRNQGNILFDPSWKLWMVDHTRAFRRHKALPSPLTIFRCESSLWENLQKVDPLEIRRTLKRYLHPAEIKGLLKRRELLIDRINGLLEERGPRLVLFTDPHQSKMRAELGKESSGSQR